MCCCLARTTQRAPSCSGVSINPKSVTCRWPSSSKNTATSACSTCKSSRRLKQQTFVDDLTGLYNSRFLKFAITNAIMKCRDPNQSFSILFIDVDHFKQVNDKYGHVIGSEFLVAIGKTIKNAVRGIDPAFRYGGDEFVVILHNSDTEGARVIAERIRKNIERRVFIIQDQKLSTTVSIGIATYPIHAAERETLLQLADEAMYSAKNPLGMPSI
ncbi:MAG: GGDEF domain-containing protein [Bdellovibrionota bacterium]